MTRVHVVARVPTEILTYIFTASLDDTAELDDTRKSPWLPAQVCRKWRSVAHGSPELWQNILVYGYRDGHRANWDSDSRLQCLRFNLECSLKYSGRRPLRIKLLRKQGWGIQTLETLLGLLWPHRARWETFTLGMDESRFDGWIAQARNDLHLKTMPMLRTLSLSVADHKSWVATDLFSLFRDTPVLTKLLLQGPARKFIFLTELRGFHWGKLRAVSLEVPLHGIQLTLPTLLASLENITVLHLTVGLGPCPVVPQVDDQYYLPNLRGLTLRGPWANNILARMTTPRLRVLELGEEAFDGHTLSGFIARSRSGIEHLIVTDRRGKLTTAILSMTSLRVLDVRLSHVASASELLRGISESQQAFKNLCAVQITMYRSHKERASSTCTAINSIAEFVSRRSIMPDAPTRSSPNSPHAKTHFRFSLPRVNNKKHIVHPLQRLRKAVAQARLAAASGGGILDIDVGVADNRGDRPAANIVESCLGSNSKWTVFSPDVCYAGRMLGEVREQLEGETNIV